MIKQDYLLRMIEEIISLISMIIINRKHLARDEWVEYESISRQIMGFDTENLINMDAKDIIGIYKNNRDSLGIMEMAAMIMLKMSEETENNPVVKSRLRQNGYELLKYVDRTSPNFSIQRKSIISLMEFNK